MGSGMFDVLQLDESLDRVFGALAHAARRQVALMVLRHGGAMSAGDIAERFRHTWPTTSRHLRVLEEAGVLTLDRQGRVRVYRLDHGKLALVRGWPREFGQSAKPPAVAA